MATCPSFPNNQKLQTCLLFSYSLVSHLSLILPSKSLLTLMKYIPDPSEHRIGYLSIVSCPYLPPGPLWCHSDPLRLPKRHVYPGQLTCDISIQKKGSWLKHFAFFPAFKFFSPTFSMFSLTFLSQNNSSTLTLYSVSSFLMEIGVPPYTHTHTSSLKPVCNPLSVQTGQIFARHARVAGSQGKTKSRRGRNPPAFSGPTRL